MVGSAQDSEAGQVCRREIELGNSKGVAAVRTQFNFAPPVQHEYYLTIRMATHGAEVRDYFYELEDELQQTSTSPQPPRNATELH